MYAIKSNTGNNRRTVLRFDFEISACNRIEMAPNWY